MSRNGEYTVEEETMEGTMRPQVPIAVRRFEIFRSLWSQGYGRIRMLDFALNNQLFEMSQLKEAETAGGRAKLLETVKEEFRAIQKEKKEARQEFIIQLLAMKLSKREITQNCIQAKLVPNPNPESAYHHVRKDIIRMTRKMRQDDLEFLPMAKSIYQIQMGRILRDATTAAQLALKAEEPDLRAHAALLKVAKEAADSLALVNKVDVTGRQQEIQKGFDLASEAARAVIDHARELRQVKGGGGALKIEGPEDRRRAKKKLAEAQAEEEEELMIGRGERTITDEDRAKAVDVEGDES